MWWDEYRNWINNRRRQTLRVEVVMVAPLPTDLPHHEPLPEPRSIHHIEADLTIQAVLVARARERHSYDLEHEINRLNELIDEWAHVHATR